MNKAFQKRQQQRIKNANISIIRNKYDSNQFILITDTFDLDQDNSPNDFDIMTDYHDLNQKYLELI